MYAHSYTNNKKLLSWSLRGRCQIGRREAIIESKALGVSRWASEGKVEEGKLNIMHMWTRNANLNFTVAHYSRFRSLYSNSVNTEEKFSVLVILSFFQPGYLSFWPFCSSKKHCTLLTRSLRTFNFPELWYSFKIMRIILRKLWKIHAHCTPVVKCLENVWILKLYRLGRRQETEFVIRSSWKYEMCKKSLSLLLHCTVERR